MKIQLRFFASLREALGTAEEAVELPLHVTTVGEVRNWLRQRPGKWGEALAEGRALRMALDHQMVESQTPIREGCELAFFPPVTGG